MATVSLRGLRKQFGEIETIKGISLEIADREFVVFVGPSGCGKSTLLRMIAGLEEIQAGDVLIDGQRVNDRDPAARDVAMVFQSYALYPHMSVADNMGFALRLAGVPAAERRVRVAEAARILQLQDQLERKPRHLSGGQRQRVAIGRAIVRKPKVFLFDEPLSNLDAALRGQMRVELIRLHEQLAATMIYVTHDQIEAMTMADRIVVLRDGVIEQTGAPMELYNKPANIFVAGFLGSPPMNFLSCVIEEADATGITVLADGVSIHLASNGAGLRPGSAATLGIRPEHLRIHPEGMLPGTVQTVERLGGTTLLHVVLAQGSVVVVQGEGDLAIAAHQVVRLNPADGRVHLFGEAGEALLF
jgi:multiple sugar transport system ATP-binding protein